MIRKPCSNVHNNNNNNNNNNNTNKMHASEEVFIYNDLLHVSAYNAAIRREAMRGIKRSETVIETTEPIQDMIDDGKIIVKTQICF